ncbi:polyketide synthase [Thozetella sp. PMI_491]|nr:polyketide synthase [Thozetella sp. PMI_491]
MESNTAAADARGPRVFLLGDQSADFVPELRRILAVTNKPILTAFLEQSHYMIRAQANLWLPAEQAKEYRSANLPQLLHKYAEGELSPAFQVGLHCLTQLASFISHYEEPGRPYASPRDTFIVGLCTGSLAAAALSCASSLSDLLPLAVHAVQVALRLGLLADDLRRRVDPEAATTKQAQSWSCVFFGAEEAYLRQAIDSFVAANELPATSRPWIAVAAGKAVTVSAPPATLEKLRNWGDLASLKTRQIPIFLPAHSSAIYTTADVDRVMESTSSDPWGRFSGQLPLLSGATGSTVWANSYPVALRQAVIDCLLEPVRWDKVADMFPRTLASYGPKTVSIVPILSGMDRALATVLGNVSIVSIGEKETPILPTPQGRAKLAIVGMSGRFPEAPSPEHFWDLLYQGLDVVKEVPAKRWNWRTHVTHDGKGHNLGGTKWGCWLDFADEFDPRFFNISPKEAPQMDPAQRMALMTSWEALEGAGFVTDTTPSSQRDRVGVFHGVTSNDYLECNSGQFIDTYFITGGNRGFIPGRVNFCFEFCGPSYTNDTACSSSLAAIHLACNSLWRGDCDTAVAGGTNMCINPDGHTGLDKGFFLSRTGNCKPFDDKADGYCRAEGVATIVIKRLDDAIADKDPILGVILDAKTNHSALSDSMTRPHVGAQVENMRAVLQAANVDPREVSYVEMHGTGTQVGDAVEMQSVLDVFAPSEGFRPADMPLHVGTVKANVGHGEGVSGIVSLSKVLLMMKHDTIPPHCGIKPGSKINHNYPDLGARNVHIAFEPSPWNRKTHIPRRSLINNFSAAGGNTALLLEDAPWRAEPTEADPRTSHLVTVSGKVAAALKNNMLRLIDHLERPDKAGLSLAQLSYTTTARRNHHLHRVSVEGNSIADIVKALKEAVARGDGSNRSMKKPKVLYTFTGQGAQYLGMGKDLYENFPTFATDLRSLDQLTTNLGFPSFLDVIVVSNGNIAQYPPVTVQLATCALEMALARLLTTFGIAPKAVVGHSLGEYAALNVAGVLSDLDTLYLVGTRATLLQQHCQKGTHSMLAVKGPAAETLAIVKQHGGVQVEVACINGPNDVVLSGAVKAIENATKACAARKLKTTLLEVPYAFHSAQVQPILSAFVAKAANVTFRKPTIPVLCPLTATVVEAENTFNAAYLARHCREAVNMAGALQAAQAAKIIDDNTYFVEVGPHPVVCGMVKNTIGSQAQTFPVLQRGKGVWPAMTAVLAQLYRKGLDITWSAYHAPFSGAQVVLELPAYAWDLKSYWIDYEADWCIYKPFGKPADGGPVKQIDWAKPAGPASAEKPLSTTVHKMISEEVNADGATLIYESDLQRPDMNNISGGHIVSNVPFATPPVYSDMAMILGEYLAESFMSPEERAELVLDVADMVADKVLIPLPEGSGRQLMRVSVKAQWAAGKPYCPSVAKCEFYSVTPSGRTTTVHAWATMYFADRSKQRSLQTGQGSHVSRIQRLRTDASRGKLVHHTKASGYDLMDSVAQFHPDFKLLDDMILDNATLEAISTLDASDISLPKPGERYAVHPGWVDAVSQIGGFVVNAQDAINLDIEVFITHGWESLQVYSPIKRDVVYHCLSEMHPDGDEFYRGDTIVLDGEQVVCFIKGVAFRKVTRGTHKAVMQTIVDRRQKAEAGLGAKKAAAKPAAPAPVRQAPAPIPAPKPVPAYAPPAQPAFVAPVTSPFAAPVTSPFAAPATSPFAVPAPAPVAAPAPARAAGGDPPLAAAPAAGADPAKLKQIEDALDVVSQESGIAIEELTDSTNFADLGVDSLLSMVIASRFREELKLALDPDFKIFVDCPTVGELKKYLSNFLGVDATAAAPAAPAASYGIAEEYPPAPPPKDEVYQRTSSSSVSPGFSAPATSSSSSSFHHSPPRTLKKSKSFLGKPGVTTEATVSSGVASAGLAIVSEESGLALSDLTDDCNFADIGVDSLLSIVIASRFREELGLQLDPDFSIFVNCPTVRDLKDFLGGNKAAGVSDNSSSDGDVDTGATTPQLGSEPDVTCRQATSVILQGMPHTATKTLFLLPDGSGSASSYVSVPTLPAHLNTAVIGLNCPYVRTPEELQGVTPAILVSAFVSEILRRQPEGPFYLGGWSCGGSFSFACAEQLTALGHEVAGLVIIDAPVPQEIDHLPKEFYDYVGSLGLYGTQTPPAYLIEHFVQTTQAMLPYRPGPLFTRRGRQPLRVGLLWACETVMDEQVNYPKPNLGGKKHFLLQARTDFSPCGWNFLLPGAQFTIDRAVGANHFTMMHRAHAPRVAALIEKILA